MTNPLVRKLRQHGPVSEAEAEALTQAISGVVEVAADKELIHDGARPKDSLLILEGFGCRYKLLEDGRRQIMSFSIAGDVFDLETLVLGKADHSMSTLSPCKIASLPHAKLNEIIEAHPSLARLLWRSTLVDAAVFRAWVTNIGQRTAYERVAHVLCELLIRLKAVGAAADGTFEMPITQHELADALGLSSVHINRVLQQLRKEELITLSGGTLSIPELEALERAALFDPEYLHFTRATQEAVSLNL